MNNNSLKITVVLIVLLSAGTSFSGKNNQQTTKKIEKINTDKVKKQSVGQKRKIAAAQKAAKRELEKMKNIEKKPYEEGRNNETYYVDVNIGNMFIGKGNDRFRRTRSRTKSAQQRKLLNPKKPKKEVYPASHKEIDIPNNTELLPTNMQTGQGLYPIYFPAYYLKVD